MSFGSLSGVCGQSIKAVLPETLTGSTSTKILQTAIPAILAVGSAVIASYGLFAMGALTAITQVVVIKGKQPQNCDLDLQQSSDARADHFVRRQLYATTLSAATSLGIGSCALWFTGSLFFGSASILAISVFKTATYGLIAWYSCNKANHDWKSRSDYSPKLKNELSDLFEITRTPVLCKTTERILVNSSNGNLYGSGFSTLKQSLDISLSRGELVEIRLIESLIEIYAKSNYYNHFHDRIEGDVLKHFNDDPKDVWKHLLPFFILPCQLKDFIQRHPKLDLTTVATYLTDKQFDDYFNTFRCVERWVTKWEGSLKKGDWGSVETTMTDWLYGAKTFIKDILEFDKLTIGLDKAIQREPRNERLRKLIELRDRSAQILAKVRSIYPQKSCEELCKTLTDEEFDRYFHIDEPETILNRLTDPIGDLTRLLIRLETLPDKLNPLEWAEIGSRFEKLRRQKKYALETREALLRSDQEIRKLRESIHFGLDQAKDTQGAIPALDLEIWKRVLFLVSQCPDLKNAQRIKAKAIQRLEELTKMASEE